MPIPIPVTSFSVSRATAATVTIFVTTADDALWLVPFVASPAYSAYEKAIHAFTFIFTLQLVVILSIILANVTKIAVTRQIEDALPLVGAILAWIIAIYLYIRSILKRRRRSKNIEEDSQKNKTTSIPTSSEGEEGLIAVKENDVGYGSVDNKDSIERPYVKGGSASSSSSSLPKEGSKLGPATVFSLALMGALDEVTYFPSLLIGGTFTGVELAVGAFVSCSVILIVITCLLGTFQPLLELMDKIPLYAVVALFATILTIEALNEN